MPDEGYKFPRYFAGCLEFFAVFQFFFSYLFHDFSQNPNGVLPNPGWDTLVSSWRYFTTKLTPLLWEHWLRSSGRRSLRDYAGSGETFFRKDFSRGPSVHRFNIYPYFTSKMKIVLVETSCPSVSVSFSVVTFDQLTPTLVFCLILKCKEDSMQIVTNTIDFKNTVLVIISN